MTDKEMRSILIEYLTINNKEFRIFQEKSIGSSVCDLMLVTDRLSGFEIKSDSDNFERIEHQVSAYEQFFDENTLVVGGSHLQVAQKKVPESWGILCIERNNVLKVRAAAKNKKVSVHHKLSFLWRMELKNLLVENNLPAFTYKTKEFIIDRIVDSVLEERLAGQIVHELLTRDYSLYNAKDLTIQSRRPAHEVVSGEFFIEDLADRLSEENLADFTLDKWMEIYRRALQVREKKETAVQKRIEKRKEHAITYRDIEVSLGAPWVSLNMVQDFVRDVFKIKDSKYAVFYEPITGHLSCNRREYINKEVRSVYGLPDYNAFRILEATLNLREIKIYNGTVYNQGETLAALEKQKQIKEAFASWVWQDDDRRWEIEETYNRMFENCEIKQYDGKALAFAGMNKKIRLFDYQKNAVQKIISTPNTLLSFDMGSGKTYIMIAAAMQMRQSGVSDKNLFVVPNNIVGQWEQMFRLLYPAAKVLTVDPKSFTAEKRQKMLRQIRDGDYDGIVIAYSCFDLIPLSRKYLAEQMQKALNIFDAELEKYKDKYTLNNTPLKNQKKYILKTMQEFIGAMEPEAAGDLTFEDLHINTLFLDEAHNYKNIPIRTNMRNLRGINIKGSNKCFEMLMKVRYVQSTNGGRGAVFATGTPLSNSISDTYNMQMYLQHEDMEKRNLSQFDNWVKTFARVEAVCEIDVDTSGFRIVNRFTEFVNLPELSKLFAQVSVFYAMDGKDLPKQCDYKNCIVEKGSKLSEYMEQLYARTEKIRMGKVAKWQDNMLKISTDGRKAALHMRLVGGDQPFDEHNKLFRCTENVLQIYEQYPQSVQLIFCDISTPKNNGFNIYGELRRCLKERGIPAREIAFIHSYKSEEEKIELYDSVNKGKIRILLGSTFKLGIGANVQSKLKAVHHLDVPWRPADMVQREGRILRRGNENDEVFIYRYIVKGSFDAYSWQILENKQKFISQFLSGTEYQRTVEDLENQELTYAQVKALALAQPLMKEYAEKMNELRATRILLQTEEKLKRKSEQDIVVLEEKISKEKEHLAATEEDKRYAEGLDIKAMKEIIAQCARVVTENLLGTPLQKICSLAEFEIFVPEKQSSTKPYLCFKRAGATYFVEFGKNVAGNIIRLKHFLSGFDKIIKNIEKEIEKAEKRMVMLIEQLKGETETAKNVKRLEREVDGLKRKIWEK